MKNLVIVESPSKSKTIEKYLGKDFKVTSSKGHICDLSISGKEGLGVDVENDFKAKYIVPLEKKKTVEELKKLVKGADKVYLATDPDREGEAISWHLARELDLDMNDNNRIVFNEITKNAVLKAIDNPSKIDMSLVKSQETRRILDRIIGFKLSNLLKRKIGSKSAGRVQSIALRLICDREKEIEAFILEESWTISAVLKNKLEIELSKYKNKTIKLHNEQEADEVLNNLSNEFKLVDISEKQKKRAAYLPFITSTLQQEASTKLSFSAKKTMSVAQKLYEGVELSDGFQGLITYMRSDSTRLSNDFISAANAKIEKDYGKQYLGKYRIKNDESSQDAHEAIRPTSLDNDPESIKEYLTNEQYKLYKLIYARALASLMADAVFSSVTYSFDNNDYLFTVSGSKQDFDGFLKVYKDYDNSKDVILPKLNKDEVFNSDKIEKTQHFSEPPARYTEAKLIKALEEEGVGRPSTYATILDTIVSHDYVELKKASASGKTKFFFPTEQGIVTDEKLREYFADVINVKYTAEMEEKLDEIANDKLDNIKELHRFYDEFQPLVDAAYDHMDKYQFKTGEVCPECGSDLIIKTGKFGKFIACSNFPKCNYTKSMKEEPVDIGKQCPECGSPLVKKKSKRGNYFIGCSNYPKCHHIEKYTK